MQFQSSSINTSARMYLYDTPKNTMAKDPMLQRLCSTSTWKAPRIMPNTSNYLFMCSRASRSTQIINHSISLELLAQHKSSITQVVQSFPLNTNKHIHISSIIGLCSGTQSTPKRQNTVRNRFTQIYHKETHHCLSHG